MKRMDRIGARALLGLSFALALTCTYSVTNVVREGGEVPWPAAMADDRASVSVVVERATVDGEDVARVLVEASAAIEYLVDAEGDSAYHRARIAAALIKDALDRGVKPRDFHAGRDRGRHVVLAGPEVIVTVTEEDARFNNLDADELAKEWAKRTKEALADALGVPEEAQPPQVEVRADRTRVDEDWVGDVLINDIVVVRLRRGWGKDDAYDAARKVAARIHKAVKDGYGPASIRAGRYEGDPAVMAGDRLIVLADNYHAELNGSTREGLAERWAGNIAAALADAGVEDTRPGGDEPYDDAWYREHYKDKWVPILSVPDGIRIGAARVNGPVDDVNRTKAVAQIETPWRNFLEIDIYVPLSTTDPGKFLSRVQGVGVTALADFDLTSDGKPKKSYRKGSIFDRPKREKRRREPRYRLPW
ncbi:MAG: hypothetical protein ACE5O2_10530 [Armatimonadota bacterium]